MRTLTLSGAMVLAVVLGAAAPAFAAPASPAASGATAPAPSFTITPGSLDFGSQEIGTASAPQTLTVTNTGSTPALFGWLDIQDPPGTDFQGGVGEFTPTVSSCTNATLAPGASCTVSLTFAPFALGPQPVVADVMADHNGTDPYQVAATASVTGTGFTDGVYVGSVTLPSSSIIGGQSVTGTIRTASTPGGSDCKTAPTPQKIDLSATAWDSVNGTLVNVASAQNPVIVPAGQCEATFTLTTSPVATDVPGAVTAHASDDPNDPPKRKSASFEVIP